ncbi:MAG: hypothetical protein ABW039_06685 [Sphingobium sp.]
MQPPLHADGSAQLLTLGQAPFSVDMLSWSGEAALPPLARDMRSWFIPLAGHGDIGGQQWGPGDCWRIDRDVTITAAVAAHALLAQAA